MTLKIEANLRVFHVKVSKFWSLKWKMLNYTLQSVSFNCSKSVRSLLLNPGTIWGYILYCVCGNWNKLRQWHPVALFAVQAGCVEEIVNRSHSDKSYRVVIFLWCIWSGFLCSGGMTFWNFGTVIFWCSTLLMKRLSLIITLNVRFPHAYGTVWGLLLTNTFI